MAFKVYSVFRASNYTIQVTTIDITLLCLHFQLHPLYVASAYVEVPFSKENSGILQGKVELSMAACTPPGISPLDLSAEDFSSLGSIYSTTLPLTQLQTVFSSYNNSISETPSELWHLTSRICSRTRFCSTYMFFCCFMQNIFKQISTTPSRCKHSMTLETCISTMEIESMLCSLHYFPALIIVCGC